MPHLGADVWLVIGGFAAADAFIAWLAWHR